MEILKIAAKNIPLLSKSYRKIKIQIQKNKLLKKLKNKTNKEIFKEIYIENTWEGKSSRSGTGSGISQTKIITSEIPKILDHYKIETILDIPCGDYFWMNHVDTRNINYTGADIVSEIIKTNIHTYGRYNVNFKNIDIINDALPKVGLIICRDCLVHLSFEDATKALNNIASSGSNYLLTTTFTNRLKNFDIITGQWRTINLETAPFNLQKPIKIINEGCTEEDGDFSDKSLGLWRCSDIKAQPDNPFK